jgi:hypothetical protein
MEEKLKEAEPVPKEKKATKEASKKEEEEY